MLVSAEWIKAHQHDLDGWVPTIVLIRPGSRQTITIKNEATMKEIIKIFLEPKE